MRSLTVGVAGVGEIGSIVAQSLRALGARVLGWRRSIQPSSAVDDLFAGTGALPRFLSACDVVVLVLPLTKDTTRLFGADLLGHCRPGAHIVNIGRGGLIDEEALLGAIETKIVRHATLDVFATEPLPPDHPFWDNPSVTITPHVCGPLVPEDIVRISWQITRRLRAGDRCKTSSIPSGNTDARRSRGLDCERAGRAFSSTGGVTR